MRLVPEVDSIGIPLFLAGNGMFVPEMDAVVHEEKEESLEPVVTAA